MPQQLIKELTDGTAVDDVYLLTERQTRTNRNGDPYLLAQLRDRTGTISGLLWNAPEEQTGHLQAGDYVQTRGKCQLYQGGKQIILTHIERVSSQGIDAADFVPGPTRNMDELRTELREILLGNSDPHLRTLLELFLYDEEFMRAFSKAPAGVKAHHAWYGGLIEHVVTLLTIACRIEPLYPQVNHALLQAGIFLHDVGKIRELDYESAFVYSDPGQLIGHLVIGIEILNEKTVEYERMTGDAFPEELAWQLKHLILSHHGRYEYGSPKLPMTPEAVALHHLDNLDAKIHEFAGMIEDDPTAESNWTPYNQRLERKLYKSPRSQE